MSVALSIVADPLALYHFRPNVRGALLHLCSAEQLELVALAIAAARGLNATIVLDELTVEMEQVDVCCWPGKVHEIEVNGQIEAFFVTMYLAGPHALFHSAEQVSSILLQGRQIPIDRTSNRIILGLADGGCVIHAITEKLRIGQPLVGVRVASKVVEMEMELAA